MAGSEASAVQPVSVDIDRAPNRWGAGGPGIPAHGRIEPAEVATADLAKKAFDLKQICLASKSKSESDEGDMDYYTTHTMKYKGEVVWTFDTSSHSNIGGAWGTDSTCKRDGEHLVVELTHRGLTVGGGHDSSEDRKYELVDVLIASGRSARALRDPAS